MENGNLIKQELHTYCLLQIEKQIKSIEQTLQSITESRNNETKSSAGDKYETGRAMMQMEEEKAKGQLMQAFQVQKELQQIDPLKKSNQVEIGSLVQTNKGTYFISIGMGKIKLDNGLFYAISVQSPIGNKLLGKTVGNSIEFNGTKINILGVY